MLNSKTEFLSLFGWDNCYATKNDLDSVSQNLIPARVTGEQRSLYRVQIDTDKSLWASISGRMKSKAVHRADYPAVGDWVMIEPTDSSDRGIIHQICPRKNILQRRQVGGAGDLQILSTNVDFVYVTTSATDDLNPRRLERYLAVAFEATATPIVLLTKADLCAEKIDELVKTLQTEFPEVQICPLSKNNFEQNEFLQTQMKVGTTSIVLGSSGVGKSTLVNFLIGDSLTTETAKTQDVREFDGKGRHTTTSRSMYVSRFGGLIIDTPGMREVQLAEHADGMSEQFADLEQLILTCRFSNCQHRTEPGCKIIEGLASGSLDKARWTGFQKLSHEIKQRVIKKSAPKKKLT